KDLQDIDYGLGDLMDDLHKIDIPRIRFTTSHPRDFDDRLIEVLAKGGNLLDHIHLPVQSGSNEVLKRIDRKSTRLNSSHVSISYAVFCLKKKRKNVYSN